MTAVLRGTMSDLVRRETPNGVVFEFWVVAERDGALARAAERMVSGFQEGDLVEVRGQRDANGVLQAETLTRVTPDQPQRVIDPPRRPAHTGVWVAGVILLGLWPFVLNLAGVVRGDDPFLVNPMIIAGGLLVLAFVWPLEPLAAIGFAIVPYVLNLFALGLVARGPLDRHFGPTEVILGGVSFLASLVLVWVISKQRNISGGRSTA